MQGIAMQMNEYDLLEQEKVPTADFDSNRFPSFYEVETGVTYYGSGVHHDRDENRFYFLKPLAKPAFLGPYEAKNFLTEFWMRKNYTRFFYPLLRPRERIVFDFILDRTIGWGKTDEWIRKVTFVKGLINYSGGTGISEPTINLAIKNLIREDLIDSLTDEHYTIQFEGVNKYILDKGGGIRYPIILSREVNGDF